MAAARNNRKRRRNRGRFSFLFQLLCVLALLVALTVGVTVFFRVEGVQVSGNSRYTEEEIVAVTGIQIGDNLYGMNKYRIYEEVLEKLPYVKGINIRRQLPSTILVTVTEWDAFAQILPDEGAAEEAARDSWLISVGGKLLERATEEHHVMEVSGLAALMPQAGTQLAVSQEESNELSGLLKLLAALEEKVEDGSVSRIEVTPTWIKMRYLGRYDVKMPLNGDFPYHLDVLAEVVSRTEEKHGPEASGTVDMTRSDCDAAYSPDEG